MSNTQLVDEIMKAIGAHGAWKMRLRTAIQLGSSDVDPGAVRCDNLCAFGKWLHGPSLDPTIKSGMPFQVTKRLHAEFHECASDVLELALRGDKPNAQALLDGEYAQRSTKLVEALSKWRRELSRPAA